MKLKKGKGLRFGYYSNSPDFLDLLSFQTTLVIDAKINKMCCPTKENACFFLVGQTFLLSFRWFNCLAEILIIFGRNKLCPLFVNFAIGHNPFLPLAWPTKRGREQSVERVSTNLLPATFLCISHTSKVWISARQFFRFFFFDIFSFLGSGSKSRIIVVGEVGAILVMINSSPDYLRHLQLIWQSRRKSTRLPVAASPKGWLRTFPLPSLSSIGGFYMPASLRFLLSDCMACNQIFYFFIRICLFSVYLHFDAVFTISHPLVVLVQAQR